MVERSDPCNPPDVRASSLAQSIAHELNNIAASLFGFVELAAEQTDPGSPVLRCLGEIRIGVSRVTNLATILESFAQVEGHAERIAIEDCVGGNAPGDSGGLRFDWKCDPATIVDSDPDRVQCALRTLAHLARIDSTTGSDLVFTVGRIGSEDRCSFCGAALPPGSVRVTLVADAVRRSDAKTGGARRRAGGTFHQLIVAGSAESAHAGGGHVVLDAAESSISLVLPAAG